MADLESLIRVRKHTVEQKQKVLAELYRQFEELEGQKLALLETMEDERRKLDDMGIEALGYFGHYSKTVLERSEEIDEALGKLQKRIDVARDDMSAAFSELKKIEITDERRKDAEEKEAKRKESALLDDIAIEGYMRSKSEE